MQERRTCCNGREWSFLNGLTIQRHSSRQNAFSRWAMRTTITLTTKKIEQPQNDEVSRTAKLETSKSSNPESASNQITSTLLRVPLKTHQVEHHCSIKSNGRSNNSKTSRRRGSAGIDKLSLNSLLALLKKRQRKEKFILNSAKKKIIIIHLKCN